MYVSETRAWRNSYRRSAKARAYDNAYAKSERGKRIRLNARLLRQFGITVEQRDAILAAQGGVCAVCKGPPRGKNRDGSEGWIVDHDHQTNKVRGILCKLCNTGIGALGDNYQTVANALFYLLGAMR